MLSRPERLARGAIVGGFATATAAVSHAAAGGYSPNAISIGTAFVFSALLATFAIGRRPSLLRLAIVVGAAQLAFHLLFSLLGAGDITAPMRMSMADMGPVAVQPATGVPAHVVDPAMWCAHALAAGATILFLRRVEQTVWSLLHEVVAFVVRVLRFAPEPVSPPRTPSLPRPRRLVSLARTAAVPRRGPPCLVSL
ncbi:MAG TPA: hypothetical protein VN759_10990 [Pseudolysinimonas sp.]|nr:hypothetical protein [Pseudolysinimonas sp.]